MKAKILGFLTIFVFLFVLVSPASAQVSPSPLPVADVNSFELFWPLAPGKTMEDPLYFLKDIKEQVRGFLIFGKAEKADYLVFVATKRAIEAEKLINDGNKDVAIKTLERCLSNIQKAVTQGEIGPSGIEGADKLLGFMEWMLVAKPDYKDQIMKIIEALKEVQSLPKV